MAEEIKQEENKQGQIPERLLKTPKVYSKSTATEEQIAKAKEEYIKNVSEAYLKFQAKKIPETKYKELLKTYKNDFDMATKGRRYLRMIKLHKRGKVINSTKLFEFGYFALNKEKTQKMVALLKDNELLRKKAKATRNNAIYMSDQAEIDKQKNNLLETELHLKYDINQFKSEENSDEKINEAKRLAKAKTAEINKNIEQQKQHNKEFYREIQQKRKTLIAEAKQTYSETKKRYQKELKEVRKIHTNSLIERIDKKQKIRNVKCLLLEARDLYKYNMFVAKNYHPAWVSDPEIKSMFTQIADNRVKRYQAQRDFDNRIDNLKKQYIQRLQSESKKSKCTRNLIYRTATWRAWWNNAGSKIVSMIIMALIVIFAILGLVDSIPASSFLLRKAYVGSISVFIFVALILFSLWVIQKIVQLVRRKAGIYDIVEAKFSKENASSSTIGLSTNSAADEFAYLEVLFNKDTEEAEKAQDELEADDKTTTGDKIVKTVLKEEGKWDKEEKQESANRKNK